jgi:adenosylhomocysteine nucleosidase
LGSLARRSDGLWAARDGTRVAVSGMGCMAAEAAARQLIESGVSGLVSWGMAGGLDPSLRAGTICLPSEIISPDGVALSTAVIWCDRLLAALAAQRGVVGGRLLTSAVAIADISGKAAAFRATRASAVDMESLAIAQVAAAHGLPFVAVRAIVDTAGDAIPETVLAASNDGNLRISRLILGSARSPLQLLSLARLAQRYRRAIAALAAVAGTGALASLT